MNDAARTDRGADAGFLIPAEVHRVEEVISRSRFLTTVAHAPTAVDAHAFVESMRAEFPDATHNCWAFVAGPPGSSASVGMSDDGEPHGTAGRPMLHALSHSEVGEVVAVCTRYYGGTKLGTGGLARAYSGGVVLALESLPTKRKVDRATVDVILAYPFVDAFERLSDRLDFVIEERQFGAEAAFRCRVSVASMGCFEQEVEELTRGSGRLDPSGSPQAQ